MTTTPTTGPGSAPAELVTLEPGQVVPHPDNIRDASRDLDAMTTSIAEVGILVPLIVVPAPLVPGQWPEGITHIAVDGARRLAAATRAGQVLPCLVRPDLAAARETARAMAVTALARDGLTDTEEAHAVQTMLDLGLTQAAISRATGQPAGRVRAAKKAARLPEPVAQAAQSLTLDQMAALADYADDEKATAALIKAAHTGRWDHTLERVRRHARDRATIARHIAALQAQGITGTAEDTFTWDQNTESLRDPDGQPITDHSSCPGHRVLVQASYHGHIYEEYYCADPVAYGHTGPDTASQSNSPAELKDAAELAARKEAEREARRTLIRLNKAALAAQDVRRAFLKASLAAKTRHRTMTAWAMARLAQRDHIYTAEVTSPATTDALCQITGSKNPDSDAATAAPTRQPLLVWATVCAAYEARYPKDAHRGASAGLAMYLDHLAALGYELSETDELVRNNGHAEAARRAEWEARYTTTDTEPSPDNSDLAQAVEPGPAVTGDNSADPCSATADPPKDAAA